MASYKGFYKPNKQALPPTPGGERYATDLIRIMQKNNHLTDKDRFQLSFGPCGLQHLAMFDTNNWMLEKKKTI
ncbi:hypothetical protein TNCV_3771001 [Trichonephila clavipes]|nr:hypothetical protein TNCV_3771001 [Trichonephila clavipes]